LTTAEAHFSATRPTQLQATAMWPGATARGRSGPTCRRSSLGPMDLPLCMGNRVERPRTCSAPWPTGAAKRRLAGAHPLGVIATCSSSSMTRDGHCRALHGWWPVLPRVQGPLLIRSEGWWPRLGRGTPEEWWTLSRPSPAMPATTSRTSRGGPKTAITCSTPTQRSMDIYAALDSAKRALQNKARTDRETLYRSRLARFLDRHPLPTVNRG